MRASVRVAGFAAILGPAADTTRHPRRMVPHAVRQGAAEEDPVAVDLRTLFRYRRRALFSRSFAQARATLLGLDAFTAAGM